MTRPYIDKPKQARSVKTREKIIRSGLRLFGEEGYHATSSKKIARDAGVATGTFYLHFKDKKALLLEIHRLHVIRVHEELESLLNAEIPSDTEHLDGLALMRKMVRLVYKTHELGPEIHREITVLSHTDPDFAEMNRDEKKRAHEKLSELLRPHLSRMRIKDIEAANMLIGLTMEAVIHSIVIDGAPLAEEQLLEALADMLHRYLFP